MDSEPKVPDFSVYPNTTSGSFTIMVSGAKQSQIEIYNALGEKIYTGKITSDKTEVNLSPQPNGVYSLYLLDKAGTASKKIIINN